MANTDAIVNDLVVTTFNNMKIKNTNRYITYKFSDNLTEIIVDSQGDRSASHDDFLAQLPDDDCRYAVEWFDYSNSTGSSLIFFLWMPDDANTKSKMLYKINKDNLKRSLPGIKTEIQGSEKSDVALDVVMDKLDRV
ncbi:actin depolymerization factor/cofilin-like domain-containing protein [Dyella jejuensis]|uniref:Actin depolymerization factor/cofilin-like domain-containing protein n=1 Tax=Dyella jejuensis TaxID=1432009 RepID=A0ABW8JNQ4_9GAMM